MNAPSMKHPGERRRTPLPAPELFNSSVGEIALALDPTTEAAPAGVLATLITGLAAMIGNRPRVAIADSDHPLLIWTLLCGRTGTGRKGTAADVTRRVLARADPPFWRQNILSGLSSAEGLIAAVRDDDNDEAANMLGDKRRLVIENEYSVVLARSRREGNALPQVLREAWDGRDSACKPSFRSSPLLHIAVSGHVSPSEFRARVSQQDLAGGSYNRFLLLHVERSKRLPEGGGADEKLVDKLAMDLFRRIAAAREVGLLQRSASARELWHALYDEFIEMEEDEDLAPLVARAVPYTMRVAAFYAALDGTPTIGTRHLDAAAALIRYSLARVASQERCN